ncbi:MAG: hypothetical protein GY816_05115 [Cytophagales bacterium]|nr:hypothetical protein [Cytophagales bacterium]
MDNFFLEFGLPLWWIFPASLIAVGLSFLLYQKKGVPWGKNKNLILGAIRFFALLLIFLLLLNPFIRQIFNETERPLVVIGIDYSSSIASVYDEDSLQAFTSSLNNLKSKLEISKDYRVELISLQGKGDSLDFNETSTDYSKFFRLVEDEFGGRNLASVVVATDGIFNRGSSPAYRPYNYPLFTLGLGDTIPQRDVVIAEVRNNAVAYSGNEFPVRVKVSGEGYVGRSLEVKVTERGKILEVKKGTITQASNEFTFFLNEEQAGVKHYTISVTEYEGEVTLVNNKREVFIEVLESKKQVLIAAKSPHPDIRSIRSVLEETGNYEVTVFIERMNDRPIDQKFDVQILMDGVTAIEGSNSGVWIINSNFLGDDVKAIPFLNIIAQGQPDGVRPSYNSNFSKFKLTQEVDRLAGYPPISVPFGDYSLSGPFEVLFYQQVGSVVTNKPLVAVFDNGDQRLAVTVGQGIWQWRLQEGATNDDTKLFAEIVQKLVQYLSINESKKQFRVSKGLETFTDGEVVYFDVEVYDDIFQLLEGQLYSLEIESENETTNRFDFVFGSESKVARTASFPSGTYSFVARTSVGDKSLTERGEFVVNTLELEQLQLTANHDLLRQMAAKSGGAYFHLSQMDELQKQLLRTGYKGIIHSDSDRTPLIDSLWALLLIAGLLGVEWGLRKFWGGY